MISLLKHRENVFPEPLEDVSVLIKPDDFPGDERIVKILVQEMYDSYRETAQIASLSFCRGSVLMQEAEEFTKDMLQRVLNS